MKSKTPRTPRTPSSIPQTASATPSQLKSMPSFALGPGLTPEPRGVCTPRRPATRGRMQRPATHRGIAAIEREIDLVRRFPLSHGSGLACQCRAVDSVTSLPVQSTVRVPAVATVSRCRLKSQTKVTAEDGERAGEWPRQKQVARSSISGERLWTAEERGRSFDRGQRL